MPVSPFGRRRHRGFRLWVISIIGTGEKNILEKMPESGIWAGFVPHLKEGDLYKYEILTAQGRISLKADPYAFWAEKSPIPLHASVICTATSGGGSKVAE